MINSTIALKLLQLIALAVPPIAVLIQMLQKSENLPWRTRKFSFGLAIISIASFICAGIATIGFFLRQFHLSPTLRTGLVLAIVGLVPFALFTGVLYIEHKANFGP